MFRHPSICTAISGYCQWFNPPPIYEGRIHMGIGKSKSFCVGGEGSKWTKINSSKRFNHYLIFCAIVACGSLFSSSKSNTICEEEGKGRNYCNCSTDYLYPGYGSQPLIRSHDLNIIYTQCVPAPRRRRIFVMFIFNISAPK